MLNTVEAVFDFLRMNGVIVKKESIKRCKINGINEPLWEFSDEYRVFVLNNNGEVAFVS